ncbi:hypothetical protein DFH08DRAFT_317683 [Mycena albidolilacea]|uniref:Uncharacterized protein n=1 Tax=Mycena albidolilacea TaxID=1033008 RepID=A0AAD6ZM66_9AGAR|nr:hypothetical protein DFH08DRAFT_317672 [Mycena albidolilacea]KAJ7328911.1 hypothetical protein DFH08DRAFT_317683 [Mycena albidolilacea]
MRFTISVLAAVFLAIQVNAAQLVAFSGSKCTGAKGSSASCNGGCHSFSGRHSFKLSGSSAKVQLFTGSGCTGQKFTFGPDPAGECINVNTGTAISTFRCNNA